MKKKVSFENKNGEMISARLDLPTDSPAVATALFAHCFTCNKNLNAVRHITRALNSQGIAVLRFDFTGLGESEGDFSETTFSHNVGDLISACEYMEGIQMKPSILIGHSLGGAAVVFAAERISNITAIVTIGAPSDPEHVNHLFQSEIEEIESLGKANVNIGGRPFMIKRDFIEDLKGKNMKAILNQLDCPILIFHSPVDEVVDVRHAAEIYKAARHPKSYISLDQADHLLSNKSDSNYVGQVIATWLGRYLPTADVEPVEHIPEKGVTAHLGEEGFTTVIHDGRHRLLADEPEHVGGEDLGPSPYELVSAGLAACTSMTLQMYARRKKWDLKEVVVEVDHFKGHAEDCDSCVDKDAKIDHMHKTIRLIGELDEKQKNRLLEIAEKCPVNRTLKGEIHLQSKLKE